MRLGLNLETRYDEAWMSAHIEHLMRWAEENGLIGSGLVEWWLADETGGELDALKYSFAAGPETVQVRLKLVSPPPPCCLVVLP